MDRPQDNAQNSRLGLNNQATEFKGRRRVKFSPSTKKRLSEKYGHWLYGLKKRARNEIWLLKDDMFWMGSFTLNYYAFWYVWSIFQLRENYNLNTISSFFSDQRWEPILARWTLRFRTSRRLSFEDHTLHFLNSIAGKRSGKIFSPFSCPKLPQSIGRLARCFLPVVLFLQSHPRMQHFKCKSIR